MQFMKILIYFCGLLWSAQIIAADNDRNKAAEQAANTARQEKESSVPTAPGDIKFVKNPKLGIVTSTGEAF